MVSDLPDLKEQLRRLRGDASQPPRASIIIPVNAEKDLRNIFHLLGDISAYQGRHPIEVILVINNYPAAAPPPEIQELCGLGLQVQSHPDLRKRGEKICLTARMPGVRNAAADLVIHFDADCRIPDSTALLDWYIAQFEAGMQLAYTHIDYFDLPEGWATRARMAIHHAFRWLKRVILRVPVSRGGNYAIQRNLMLDMYERGMLTRDIKVGPTVKAAGGRIAYSGDRARVVMTSGRNFTGTWQELLKYIRFRIGYYRRVEPLRPGIESTDAAKGNQP